LLDMTPTEPSIADWVGVSEAARILSVSEQTVRNWADEGTLASIRTPGRQRRFKREDVLALLAAS
jgi:excisionase family DNA binding protein